MSQVKVIITTKSRIYSFLLASSLRFAKRNREDDEAYHQESIVTLAFNQVAGIESDKGELEYIKSNYGFDVSQVDEKLKGYEERFNKAEIFDLNGNAIFAFLFK